MMLRKLVFSGVLLGWVNWVGADSTDSVFGEPMPAAIVTVKLSTALETGAALAGQMGKFSGSITEVCQKKGCWAILTDGQFHARLKFDNYDYSLPLDSAGAAVVYGELITVRIDDKLAKHFAEDAGKDTATAAAAMEHQIKARSVQLTGS